jgi:ATP:ADP antiporter, AAA family
MTDATRGARRKSLLEWFLGLFTEVRPGEGATALLLTLNVFLLLTTYYIIKPVREALILAGGEGGAEVKSYAAAGQAILLLGLVPLYSAIASRVSRRRLINIVTLFFVGCLVLFFALAQAKTPYIGVIFFLWVGIFSLMVIAQFWSFANDLYTPEEGKRLFAIIAFGASAGAAVGSLVLGGVIKQMGVAQPLLIAAATLGASLIITNIVDRRERDANRARAADAAATPTAGASAAIKQPPADESMGKGGAFRLVLSKRYLLLIALLILFLNWVNTTGEYILGRTVKAAAESAIASGTAGGMDEGQFIGKFYSDFFLVVNLLGLAIQLLLVSRIIKYFGVRFAILLLPIIALGGYTLLAFYPVLSVVRWIKTAENATEYSLNNTVRHALFLPTTREEKYKAKQAIDSFFQRAGDVLSAGLVFAGTTWLSFETQHFALVNIALVAVWLVLAVWIGRENRRATETEPAAAGREPSPPGETARATA